jgi:hypothetical protein
LSFLTDPIDARLLVYSPCKIGPDHSGSNLLNGGNNVWPRAPLIAHLYGVLVFFCCSNQQFTFMGIVAAGFFQVNMFSCFGCKNGGRGMPVIGSSDNQCIQVFIFQGFSEIWLCSGL